MGGIQLAQRAKGLQTPSRSHEKETQLKIVTRFVFLPMAYAQRQTLSDQLRAAARHSKMQARGSRYSGGAGTGGGFGNLSMANIRQGNVEYAAMRAVAAARAMTPTETKYFDCSFSQVIASGADWTGTEVPCTNYIQSDGTTVGAYTDSALIPSAIGAGYGQVSGNQLYLKKLRVRGLLIPSVTSDSADVIAPASVRVALVLDLQPGGSQAQGEQVFSDMGGGNQCNFSFLAMGAGTGGRFRILKDKVFVLQPGSAGTDGASTNSVTRYGAQFSFSVNWRKALRVILKANSSTPTVASLANCNIFLLAHAGLDVGTVSINGVSRCYYTD